MLWNTAPLQVAFWIESLNGRKDIIDSSVTSRSARNSNKTAHACEFWLCSNVQSDRALDTGFLRFLVATGVYIVLRLIFGLSRAATAATMIDDASNGLEFSLTLLGVRRQLFLIVPHGEEVFLSRIPHS